MNRIFSSVAFILALLTTISCSKINHSETSTPQSRENVFSDRPIGMNTEILMVQLFQPPLLETAMEPSDIQAVLDEQARFEKQLSALSHEVKVLYRYHYTLNGMALVTPQRLIPDIEKLVQAKSFEPAHYIERPKDFSLIPKSPGQDPVTSVSFIGAQALHQMGITGKGVKVGVIDTGIDYTHKMLGGSGKASVYKAIDPGEPSSFFPNDKVVGGVDLAGSKFTGKSDLYDEKVPFPDANPLDEMGHGSHVAGTIAGRGDGVNTYDGVAPDAKLYAIKVFGKEGGTFDAIVIAGFEYAMDPNGDFNVDDRLDVVNLSLGGEFGTQKILYTKAIKNLSRSGMVVVAAAGNSGDKASIVGAPGTADDALSVAASVDGRMLNWKFETVKFALPDGTFVVSEFAQGPITKPLSEIEALQGELVDLGKADQDLTQEQKDAVKGKVAFIERGIVPFVDKIKRAAEAGAIGVIVYNSEPGAPIPMGAEEGQDPFSIPGVMISQEDGQKVAAGMKNGAVIVDFKSKEIINKPDLIDTITDFSSRGPRTDDYGFKPEVAAPGNNILSAGMGTGDQGVLMSGTSMASPHVAGAVALLRQRYPSLTTGDLKSLLMNTAKTLVPAGSKTPYTFSTQGAGRIQLVQAAEASFLATGSLAVGLVEVPEAQAVQKTLRLKNISSGIQKLDLSFKGKDMIAQFPARVTLYPGEEKEISLRIQVQDGSFDGQTRTQELDGALTVTNGAKSIQVPVMAFRTERSEITTEPLQAKDGAGSLTLVNKNQIEGSASLFHLIAEDAKKSAPEGQEWRSTACDLKSAGYRVLTKTDSSGKQQEVVQFAFQLYETRNQLKYCDFSVLVDVNKDGEPDQEIVGVGDSSIYGFQGQDFFAAVLDYQKAQALRLSYEVVTQMGKKAGLDFRTVATAVGNLQFMTDTGLTLLEIPRAALQANLNGNLSVKIAAINNLGDAVEGDDYLGGDETTWRRLNLNDAATGNLSDVTLKAGETKTLSFEKSEGLEDLVLYSATNKKTSEMEKIIAP